MIWCMNEDLDKDVIRSFVKFVIHHIAHPDTPIVDRSSDVKGSERLRPQDEMAARSYNFV